MGSNRMTLAPTTTAAAVSSMGRKAHGACIDDSFFQRHALRAAQFDEVDEDDRIAHNDPAPAMKPIIEVAVKNAPIMACAGKNADQRERDRCHDHQRRVERSNQPTTST